MRILLALQRPLTAEAFFVIVAMLLASCSSQRSSPIPPTVNGAHARSAQSSTSAYANTILSTSGLVAYYRLGDIGTTTAVDSGPKGFSGTYNGLGTGLTQGTPGLISGDPETSTTCNGSTSCYVATPRNTAFETPTTISVETWVKLSSTAFQALVEYGSHTGQPFTGYGLEFSTDHVAFQLKLAAPAGTTTIVVSPIAAVTGQIYHVVGTYDGATAKLYVNGQLVTSTAVSGPIQYDGIDGGFIFNNQGHNLPTHGALQEVAFYNTALTATQVQNHYAAGTSSQPPPSVTYSDWNTFGDSLSRQGFNGNEKGLSQGNVGSLKIAWSTTDLGGAITAQPILASGLSVNGTSTNVLYIGGENGQFYALNADTGAVLSGWPKQLGSVTTSCTDLPNEQFGITGTATFDRPNNVVYVADGNDVVHALDMVSGSEKWNVSVLTDPNTGTVVGSSTQDHIYGALTYNPVNGLLYVETASFCDNAPWHGRIVAINTSTHQVTAAFFPERSSQSTNNGYCGGGIWGMGGASIDTATQNVFVATGNIVTGSGNGCTGSSSQTYPYGDAVVELDQNLNLISSSPATVKGNTINADSDYGATPMLYNISGCPELLSAKNKNGRVYTYSVGSGGLRYVNAVQVGVQSSEGTFVGVPAFDPAGVNEVYTGNPNAVSPYANGLIAFRQKGSCNGLTLAWQASVGSAVTSNDNQAPTVANGVVFFSDGVGDHLWAFAATQSGSSGTALFNSGTTIGPSCTYGTTCGVFGAATVDGRVFVGSWNHKLYAFSY
jgi:hypothetical protein